MAAFLGSSAVASAPARLLLLQAAGDPAGGRGLLLKGVGAFRSLVAFAPRCTAGGGDLKQSDDGGDEIFNSKPKAAMEEALDAVALSGVGDQKPSEEKKEADSFTEALAAAMEEARLTFSCTAVVVRGDKALVDQVGATVVLARDLVAAMAKGAQPDLCVYNYKEIERVAVAFAELESQCHAGFITADGLLGAMEGLRSIAYVFLGSEAAAGLRPCRARPPAPLSAHEDQANFVWDLSKDFDILVEDVQWAARGVAIVDAVAVSKTKHPQFLVVHGDKLLLENLTGTCLDSQALLARLVAKAVNGPFPLTDAATLEEVVGIAKSFVKLEVECGQGFARADSVVAAMDGLKAMTAVFAGTAVAAGLRPYNARPAARISGEDDTVTHMWNLATALGILFYDVKFRCIGLF